MLLRRLADAMRRQDWFTVLLEIFIVMVGIFLGLQANAWNQSRIDRAEEAVFLKALYEDILALEESSSALVELRVQELEAIASGSDVLFGKTEWRELTEFECHAISASHRPGIIATSLPSWAALRDAGRTGIVTGPDLRRDLATLTQKRESLDRIMSVAEQANSDLLSMHPKLFRMTPVRTKLPEAPERIYFTTEASCDSRALSQDQVALTRLAANMNRFSSVVSRFGIIPWAEQVKKTRQTLEGIL
ncbi:MAG: hypothetical protein AAGG55_05525 [Pseudomonadota bacterium]